VRSRAYSARRPKRTPPVAGGKWAKAARGRHSAAGDLLLRNSRLPGRLTVHHFALKMYLNVLLKVTHKKGFKMHLTEAPQHVLFKLQFIKSSEDINFDLFRCR
jgi:hypothetical protein